MKSYLWPSDEDMKADGLNTALYEGGPGDDTVTGGSGNDEVYGYAGNDTLYGGEGHDTLNGGEGNDLIYGQDGNDIVLASGGQDTFSETYGWSGGDGPDKLFLWAGAGVNDIAFERPTNFDLLIRNLLTGDTVTLPAFYDRNGEYDQYQSQYIYLNDGVTELSPFTTIVTRQGTAGDDTLTGQAHHGWENVPDRLMGLDGNDVLWGHRGADILLGGAGNDILYGDQGDNAYGYTGSGDTLDGGDGNDIMIGDGGNDTYIASHGSDRISSGVRHSGDHSSDTLLLWLGSTRGAMTFTRSGNDLQIYSGSDRVTLADYYTTGHTDIDHIVLDGGSELRVQVGTNNHDTLNGTTYDDVLAGAAGDDVLNGLQGDDMLNGGLGYNRLYGGAGNDLYQAGTGEDRVSENAGQGDDSVLLWADTNPATLGFGRDGMNLIIKNTATHSQFVIQDYLSASHGYVEHIVDSHGVELDTSAFGLSGTVGQDTLTGDFASVTDDNLAGLGGDDTLYGLEGKDALDGGDGDDTMIGGNGDDTYIASAGHDALYEYSSTGDDTARLWAGTTAADLTFGINYYNLVITNDLTGDTLFIYQYFYSGTPQARIEHLVAGDGSELDPSQFSYVVTGTAGNDTLTDNTTGSQNDRLLGLDGNDKIYALAGNDTLEGGQGNDALLGDEGDDVLDGGDGNDQLAGGLGSDLYLASHGYDIVSETSGDGEDTVQLWAGTTAANVRFDRNVYDLMIHNDANGDVFTIKYYFHAATPNAKIEHVLDGNGQEIDVATASFNAVGTAGNDVLYGYTGNDLLQGLDGNDWLAGYQGDDTFDGGNGIDTVSYAAAAAGVTVDLTQSGAETGDGHDVFIGIENLSGSNYADTLTGDGGNNAINGGNGNDTLYGGDGNDQLDGSSGVDRMYGGLGNDSYSVDKTSDQIVEGAAEGIDFVVAFTNYTLSANIENLQLYYGTSATGNALDNVIQGNSAANVLNGGLGADTLIGNGGGDTFVVDNAGDVIQQVSDSGIDLVKASISYTLVNANIENLTLTGAANINATGHGGANLLTGNNGHNRLDGGAGADTMAGGLGNDTYIIDNAGDVVTELAGEGVDTVMTALSLTLAANVENLVLTGTAAGTATGNALNNALTGNSNNNRLDGGPGVDTLTGLGGSDTYFVDDSLDQVVEAAGGGVDIVMAGASYTLAAEVERLTLAGSADIWGTGNGLDNILIGNGGNNRLDGGAGADGLAGGAGNDTYVVDNSGDKIAELAGGGNDTILSSISWVLTGAEVETLTLTGTADINATGNKNNNSLNGNAGNNKLDGYIGADTMAGGAGNDTYVVDNAGDVVHENDGEGTDAVLASQSTTLGDFVELLYLTGSGHINGSGNAQNNSITGNTGMNTLWGQDGNDFLRGGAGNDTLYGGTGDDALYGGTGNDVLVGSFGKDIFVFELNSGQDTVDFKVSDRDVINIHAYSDGVVGGGGVTISQSGADTLIDLGGGNMVLVYNVTASDPGFLNRIVW